MFRMVQKSEWNYAVFTLVVNYITPSLTGENEKKSGKIPCDSQRLAKTDLVPVQVVPSICRLNFS
jgi:hypothetical protein